MTRPPTKTSKDFIEMKKTRNARSTESRPRRRRRRLNAPVQNRRVAFSLRTEELRLPAPAQNRRVSFSLCAEEHLLPARVRAEAPCLAFPMLKATTSRVRSKPPRRRIAAQVIRFHSGLNLARRRTTVARSRNILKRQTKLSRCPNNSESVKATANEIIAPTKRQRKRQSNGKRN